MSAYVVIKIGGEVVASPHMAAIAADVAEMQARGERVVVVHGGGPQATDLQKKLGQTPNIVAGRRITDADTLDVMKMVVGGMVNVDACAALLAAGASPVGLHGASASTVARGEAPAAGHDRWGPDPVDFGSRGRRGRVNEELLALLSRAGLRARSSPRLGADREGHVYNINADIVANQRGRRPRRQGAGAGERRARGHARREPTRARASRGCRSPRGGEPSPRASSPGG